MLQRLITSFIDNLKAKECEIPKQIKNIPYLRVTIGVQQAAEISTVLAVFKSERLHPLVVTAPTFGLYCKYCTYVRELNLNVDDIIIY